MTEKKELSEIEKYKIESRDFFSLEDGEEKTMIYHGVKIDKNQFHKPDDPKSKEMIPHYTLEYFDYPKKVTWSNKRSDLLDKMTQFKEGDVITIRREGLQKSTNYYIRKSEYKK